MPPIRGINRGYMFTGTRMDLLHLLRLVANKQMSPYSAFDLIEQYVISGRELPEYVPSFESEQIYTGEN
jgi:hypothetical protein